jgi:hypothetical protein
VQCTKRLDEIAELARAYGSADITEKINGGGGKDDQESIQQLFAICKDT